MNTMKNLVIFINVIIFTGCLMSGGCNSADVNSYKTYVMDQGLVHFSLEYPANYMVDYVEYAESSSDKSRSSAIFSIMGPKDRHVNDYTDVCVVVDLPDRLMPDAKSLHERSETNAESWKYYELIYKGEMIINGISAYRLDYQNIDILPAIANDGGPGIEVMRRVDFDADGRVWTIYMTSPLSAADADKVHFEHILETFEILE